MSGNLFDRGRGVLMTLLIHISQTGKSTTVSVFLPALIRTYGFKNHIATLQSGTLPEPSKSGEAGVKWSVWWVKSGVCYMARAYPHCVHISTGPLTARHLIGRMAWYVGPRKFLLYGN